MLTHAHAFHSHPAFNLIGFVDANREQATRATQVWGGRAFTSIRDALTEYTVDVAVVAVPDELHYQVLNELSEYPLKLVFAEKPLAKSLAEANQIVEAYRKRGVVLAVNYTRRYVPEFMVLRDQISSGEFGQFLAGNGCYGKGILHNGSHMVDLVRHLIGEIADTTTLGCIYDWCDDDPTCSATLELSNGGRFVIQAVDSRCFTIFELDFLFERKRVRLIESGLFVVEHEICDSKLFSGYHVLSEGKRLNTSLGTAFAAISSCIYEHLTSGVPLPCTGSDGVRAIEICSNIARGCK